MMKRGRFLLCAALAAGMSLAAFAAAAETSFEMGRRDASPLGVLLQPAFQPHDDAGSGGRGSPRSAFDIRGGGVEPGDSATLPATIPTTDGLGAPFAIQPRAPAAVPDRAPAPGAGSPGDALPGNALPFQMVPGQALATAAPPPVAVEASRVPDRFIIPIPSMRLEGESVSRAWVMYFTPQELRRPATLLVGYTNSIFVMPERSRLRVTINGQFVTEIPIASPQGATQIAAEIPAAVLRPGGNLIRLDMQAVHRTDCSIQSTYELWTTFDNRLTGIAFEGGPVSPPTTIDNLPAIGVDDRGTTNIRFIHNGPLEPEHSNYILRAAQAIALRGQFPNPLISVVSPRPGAAPPGTLNVIVGTSENLRSTMDVPPALSSGQPLVRFVNDSRIGGAALVLGGETSRDVEAAIDRLTAGMDYSDDETLTISTRFAPDAPFFNGARSVRFSDLGVTTQEFSGRRLRVRFPIALPADFYGAADGQARILLDAAYASSVRPGSQLSVYVNDSLASTYMLTGRSGGLLNHQVIKIPMTHFRAGLNRIWLEVVLDVEADQTCGPGATLARQKRFVLFDSSEFVMDNFARIGTTPNLAAFFGRGYPYFHQAQPVAVVIRHDAATVATAATIMARLALSREGIAPVDTAPNPASLASRPVLFVGDINQIPSDVLREVGVAEAGRIKWLSGPNGDSPARNSAPESGGGGSPGNADRPPTSFAATDDNARIRSTSGNDDIYGRWRDQVAGHGAIQRFEKWVMDNFSIALGASMGDGANEPFDPPPQTSVLVAQSVLSKGNAVWTVFTGRTSESLLAAIDTFTMPEYWLKGYGQAVAYNASSGKLDLREPTSTRFIVTEPLGPSNLRLIAANWLSLNIVSYALVLILCCIAFAFATNLLIRYPRDRSGKGG
ncbi:cellulose biosynthesis cyclic di-GMP-binding regulatory protein BcsB [Ancylobacter sp.]|uniref:cellulose biosynthesis cyclic di-GMP-binding regulatory protein BcsB n=1 Tax=Ancylobacter sp. TaxID=1872567 RepID=UPI003D13EFBD